MMRCLMPNPTSSHSAKELYRDAYVTLVADPDGIVVRMIRSTLNHPSVQAMEASYMEVARTLDRIGRKGRCLLVDTRNALGRNEPDYDVPFRRARDRIDVGFLRIAVLLRTATGMLQVMRISEEDGLVRLITMNEADAIAYLRDGTVPPEPRSPTGKTSVR